MRVPQDMQLRDIMIHLFEKHRAWYAIKWHNEMHVYASRGAYFHEMWCMI